MIFDFGLLGQAKAFWILFLWDRHFHGVSSISTMLNVLFRSNAHLRRLHTGGTAHWTGNLALAGE